jgi:hypothetical protein
VRGERREQSAHGRGDASGERMPLHAIDRTGEPRRRGEGGRRGRVRSRAVSRSVSTPRSATPTIAVGTATPGPSTTAPPSSSTRAGVTPRSRSSATIARAPPAVSSLWPKER